MVSSPVVYTRFQRQFLGQTPAQKERITLEADGRIIGYAHAKLTSIISVLGSFEPSSNITMIGRILCLHKL